MFNYKMLDQAEKDQVEEFLKEFNLTPEFGAACDGAADCDWQDPMIMCESEDLTEAETDRLCNLPEDSVFGVVVWDTEHDNAVALLKKKNKFCIEQRSDTLHDGLTLTEAFDLVRPIIKNLRGL